MTKENIFKGRIARGAKDLKDSPSRLGRSINFDHGLTLPDDIDLSKLVKVLSISGYKQEQKLQDLRILLANLIQADGKPISLPIHNNYWHRPQYNAASAYTIDLVEQLQNLKIIDVKAGFHTEQNSRITRIWATDLLKQYCPKFHDMVIYEPVNLVELRDWTGKLLPYKETAWTWRVKDILKLVNTVNGAADIRRGNEAYKAFLIAVYKQKFTLYGRLHTRGFHHVQGLSEDKRSELTIDGQPVIELDFSALHPNLLYSSIGVQYEGDPYQVVHEDPITRPYLKQLLLCLLNAKDFTQAERAGNKYLNLDMKPRERKALKAIGITRARPLLEAFTEAHQPISSFFCSGKETGLRTMNKDSKIALDVINDFAKQNIPILCVHDSFLVQTQFRDQLRDTMRRRYKQHTKGFDIYIK